ncbi:hypothetical protein Q6241_28300, partial [Klebsiella pneumoniae]
MPAYKRILLKLSGEALMGDDAYGINRATIVRMVQEVREVTQMGVEVAVVIGGGNIVRGVAGGHPGASPRRAGARRRPAPPARRRGERRGLRHSARRRYRRGGDYTDHEG